VSFQILQKKKDFRKKVLKIGKRSKVKEENDREDAMRLLSVSIRAASIPGPALCMFVYHLSFLHLLSPPVRLVEQESERKLTPKKDPRPKGKS
jgi:hypothetical protein